jgi:hypothetical protein
MDPARWKKIDELIDAALELPEREREAFIMATLLFAMKFCISSRPKKTAIHSSLNPP